MSKKIEYYYNNYQVTAMKYAESGEIYKPYKCSKNKNVNPLIIERLNY